MVRSTGSEVVNSNLDKIKAKIAAMMNLAKDKAATESEAEVALRMAMKLMKMHSLTMDDLATGNVRRSDFTKANVDKDRVQIREVDRMCAMSIAKFCDCRAWGDRVNGGVNFYGYSVDVELALYIRDLLIKTVEYEWNVFKAGLKGKVLYGKDGKKIHTKTIRTSFVLGFCERVRERLTAMKKDMVEEQNGTALVLAKNHLVNAALEEEIDTSNIKAVKKTKGIYTNPANAGRDAGDRVKFNRAVGDGPQGKQMMIGAN